MSLLIGGEQPPTTSAAESNSSTAPSARTYIPLQLQPSQVASALLTVRTRRRFDNIPMALFRTLAVALLWVTAAVAAPIHYPQEPLVPGSSPSGTCDSIDKFTMQWFLENTKPEYRREIIGKALFYTAGASEAARKLACREPDEKYVTIWQICMLVAYFGHSCIITSLLHRRMLTCFLIPGKPWLYDDSPSPDNPLRCIHANLTLTHTYYSNMSNAYARMARKSATVMHKKKDYDNPPMNGIWGKTELPALRYKTDVKEVSYLFSQRPSPRQICLLSSDRSNLGCDYR